MRKAELAKAKDRMVDNLRLWLESLVNNNESFQKAINEYLDEHDEDLRYEKKAYLASCIDDAIRVLSESKKVEEVLPNYFFEELLKGTFEDKPDSFISSFGFGSIYLDSDGHCKITCRIVSSPSRKNFYEITYEVDFERNWDYEIGVIVIMEKFVKN